MHELSDGMFWPMTVINDAQRQYNASRIMVKCHKKVRFAGEKVRKRMDMRSTGFRKGLTVEYK